MKSVLKGIFTGSIDKFGAGMVPVIECESAKPVFHESGYASGHADQDMEIPGLLEWLKANAPERDTPADTGHLHYSDASNTGWCWSWVQFRDKRSPVFLGHVYDGRKDTYSLTN